MYNFGDLDLVVFKIGSLLKKEIFKITAFDSL
jgi:hypothetical protein